MTDGFEISLPESHESKRVEYAYTNSEGVSFVIAGVPVNVRRDWEGNEHQTLSARVASRLDELMREALEYDATPGRVHRLGF